ncbi:hypothetical protein HY3_09285 [Hyphomonas pacifica]|uniref:FecR protein domain-containing protein n=2 Tax=Hyphomonas pacifica TaxID=1280941 RepID=A0A062U384_9PROT|nr:hypothetical protein HY2_09155 [Hyphomonas pacifica]RAN35027.1 hypothetical protein HY3_09285 [Hyphomonas pacifica]
MTDQSNTIEHLREEAAGWAVRLDAGPLSDDERRELARWLQGSPAHVDEFLTACVMFDLMSDTEDRAAIDFADLMVPAEEPVVSLQAERARRGFLARHVQSISAVAAALAVAVVSLALLREPAALPTLEPTPILAATAFGETDTLALEDGSTLAMNTETELRVTLSDSARTVSLSTGEVFADVAHAPDRPFRVLAGDTPVEALGTAFNVRYLDGNLRVDVREGVVLVGAGDPIERAAYTEALQTGPVQLEDGRVLLGAGQWMALDIGSTEPRLGRIDLANVAAWQEGRLVFENTPLADIAAEFNRYNRTRLLIADADLAGERVSAVFDARDPEALIASLELTGQARAERRGGEIRLVRD